MTGWPAVLQAEAKPGSGFAGARAWNAPVFEGASLPGRQRPAEEEQEARRQQYSAAEAEGRAAGLAAARQQIDVRLRALDAQAKALAAALDALSSPLAHVDDEVHGQIAQLAVQIARALLRRELRTDPSQVIGIVRDTVALLPASTRGVRVVLHPEDAALVRERLVAPGPQAAWTIIDDPVLGRGDCRVHTDYAQLDARIETRLNEALAALLGEERAQPRGGEEP